MKHEWRDGTRTRITSDASKTELNRVPYALTRHCERIPKTIHISQIKKKKITTLFGNLFVLNIEPMSGANRLTAIWPMGKKECVYEKSR